MQTWKQRIIMTLCMRAIQCTVCVVVWLMIVIMQNVLLYALDDHDVLSRCHLYFRSYDAHIDGNSPPAGANTNAMQFKWMTKPTYQASWPRICTQQKDWSSLSAFEELVPAIPLLSSSLSLSCKIAFYNYMCIHICIYGAKFHGTAGRRPSHVP